jgi:beta-glucosidase
VTIYHWDLPQVLEDRGGWTNREVVDWFLHYTNVVTSAFGDRVKHWIVMNEPMTFTGLGYFTGYHAPGRNGIGNFMKAAHHATLCMAEGGRMVRRNV